METYQIFFLLTPLINAKLSGKMVVQLKKIVISSWNVFYNYENNWFKAINAKR